MILLGNKEAVALWVLERIRGIDASLFEGQWFDAIGFLDQDEKLQGGVIYHHYRGYDIEALAAGEGQWLTPLKTRAIFLYPFTQLGCRRMTTYVARKNKRSRRFVERLGFRLEGTMRQYMPDGKDAMVYGMLASECRWIEHAGQSRTEARGEPRGASGFAADVVAPV